MRSLFSRATALGVLAMAVAGCAASNGTALPPTSTANNGGGAQGNIVANSTGQGFVQFVHGSPDAGVVDVCVDGQFAATGVAFKSFTGFFALAGGVGHVVSVYSHTATDPNGVLTPAATTDLVNGQCSANQFGVLVLNNGKEAIGTITPTANVRNTVVIAGTNANNTLQFVAATAPATIPGALAPAVLFINASPANPKLAAGSFNATTGAGETASATTFGLPAVTATPAAPTFGALTVPAFAETAGVAYYIAKTATNTTPIASVYAGAAPAAPIPSAAQATSADASNPGNLLPFVAKNDYLLTAVAVDQASGTPLLIGHYDPITLGY